MLDIKKPTNTNDGHNNAHVSVFGRLNGVVRLSNLCLSQTLSYYIIVVKRFFLFVLPIHFHLHDLIPLHEQMLPFRSQW